MDCHSEPFAVILSEAKHLALGAQGKLREESRSPPGGLKAKEQSEIPRCARNDICGREYSLRELSPQMKVNDLRPEK